MKKETFCKKNDFFEKKWDSKKIFFQNSKKLCKMFSTFLKKIVNSILKDLYEYLFLKIPAKNSSFK